MSFLKILTKPPVLILLAFVFVIGAGLFCYKSVDIGDSIGSGVGKMTGLAVGSYRGVTDGLENGAIAGKEAGLNAEDTTIEIAHVVQNVGNLEVLVANVEIPDYHEVGEQYAALYLFRGNAVFSVDLTKASISKSEDGEIVILLPNPVAVVNINDSETKLLAEYQRKYFNGKADDGFQAYLNTLSMIDSISIEKVSNYDVLMDMARMSAKKQVELLSSGVCVNCKQITVLFRPDL